MAGVRGDSLAHRLPAPPRAPARASGMSERFRQFQALFPEEACLAALMRHVRGVREHGQAMALFLDAQGDRRLTGLVDVRRDTHPLDEASELVLQRNGTREDPAVTAIGVACPVLDHAHRLRRRNPAPRVQRVRAVVGMHDVKPAIALGGQCADAGAEAKAAPATKTAAKPAAKPKAAPAKPRKRA